VKRTRTSPLRRVVMWAAGMVLVLSVVAWMISLIVQIEWSVPPAAGDSHFSLQYGKLRCGTFDYRGYMPPPGWSAYCEPGAPQWDWPSVQFLRSSRASHLWLLHLPLWVPALSAGVVCGAVIIIERWNGRRAGHCAAGGYDLVGISGPLPECGRQQ